MLNYTKGDIIVKQCIRCGIKKAELPLRGVMGRPLKRICRECHREELRKDFLTIVKKPGRIYR